MVAATSIANYRGDSFKQVAASQRGIVYGVVEQHEIGLSRRQIAEITGMETSSVAGRVNELIAEGILEVTGNRTCPLSGKNVQVVSLVLN